MFKLIHFLTSEEGDWVGIYVDGKLIMQGHSFRARDLAEWLGREYGVKVTSAEKDEAWFEKHGYECPTKQPK